MFFFINIHKYIYFNLFKHFVEKHFVNMWNTWLLSNCSSRSLHTRTLTTHTPEKPMYTFIVRNSELTCVRLYRIYMVTSTFRSHRSHSKCTYMHLIYMKTECLICNQGCRTSYGFHWPLEVEVTKLLMGFSKWECPPLLLVRVPCRSVINQFFFKSSAH